MKVRMREDEERGRGEKNGLEEPEGNVNVNTK